MKMITEKGICAQRLCLILFVLPEQFLPLWMFSALQETDFYSLALVTCCRATGVLGQQEGEGEGGGRRASRSACPSAPFCSALLFLTQANPPALQLLYKDPTLWLQLQEAVWLSGSLIYVPLPSAGSSGLRSQGRQEGKLPCTARQLLTAIPFCSALSSTNLLQHQSRQMNRLTKACCVSSACLFHSSEEIWTFLSQRRG